LATSFESELFVLCLPPPFFEWRRVSETSVVISELTFAPKCARAGARPFFFFSFSREICNVSCRSSYQSMRCFCCLSLLKREISSGSDVVLSFFLMMLELRGLCFSAMFGYMVSGWTGCGAFGLSLLSFLTPTRSLPPMRFCFSMT